MSDAEHTLADAQAETLAGAPAGPGGRAAPAADVLGGRYHLGRRIASGGMASVWEAHDEVLARTVAVKVLHDHLAADEGFRERFRREAISAAKLTHPNVVSLYDTGTDGDRVYLVMEFVAGATLKDVIAEKGSLPVGHAASIGEKVARALDYAHERGLVHRDVKPANILIGDDGSVKVADFGIAKAEEAEADLTKTGMVLGTAAYVAPEQITGSAPVNGRADQYALGCMVYESLTGRQPFKGDTAVATAAQRLEQAPTRPRDVRADIPRGLEAVLLRALERHPDDRFGSAGQFADALAAFGDADTAQTAALAHTTDQSTTAGVDTDDTEAQRVAVYAPTGRGTRQRSWLWALTALVLVGAAVIGIAYATGQLSSGLTLGVGLGGAGIGGDVGEGTPLEVSDLDSFDPVGGDGESDGLLDALLDGDDETAWETERYNGADFGGFDKPGVGVIADLGDERMVHGVEVTALTPDLNYAVYAADERSDDVADWTLIGEAAEAGERSAVAATEEVSGRYVLLLVTEPLPAADGGYRAKIAELVIRGS